MAQPTLSIHANDRLFIDGNWTAPHGKEKLSVISPVTEETLMLFPDGTPERQRAAICTRPDAERLTKANSTMYGLHGAVYTADPERGYQIARRVRSGSVTVNGLIVDYKMPFGGFKQSGIGREGGIEGLENYFETKTVYFG